MTGYAVSNVDVAQGLGSFGSLTQCLDGTLHLYAESRLWRLLSARVDQNLDDLRIVFGIGPIQH